MFRLQVNNTLNDRLLAQVAKQVPVHVFNASSDVDRQPAEDEEEDDDADGTAEEAQTPVQADNESEEEEEKRLEELKGEHGEDEEEEVD